MTMNRQWVQDRGIWVPAYRALDSGLLVPHNYDPDPLDKYVAYVTSYGTMRPFTGLASLINTSDNVEFERVINESWW